MSRVNLTKPYPVGRRIAIATVVWQVALLALWTLDETKLNLSWKINQLGWALFGPPDNLYNFANLALPRLLAWSIVATPAAVIGLVVFERLSRTALETRCRKCGYILKGLAEPRCSECGEQI